MSKSTSNIKNNHQSLENKINIYKKQITILEEKIKVYEEDSNIKQQKISEQLNHIIELETENSKLKSLLNKNNKISQTLVDKNYILTTSSQKNVINNNNNSSEDIKSLQILVNTFKKENENLIKELTTQKNENEKISRNLQMKKEESDKLFQTLKEKTNENEIYNQDNVILLNKLKEYEENFALMKNNK